MIFIAAIIAIITGLVLYVRHLWTYWSRNGVPGPNYIAVQYFFGKHHEMTVKLVKQYGRIFGTYDLLRKSINISEPDLLRDILVKDSHIFLDRKDLNTGSSKINKSLFFLPGSEDWKRIRSILSPTFTSGKLRRMLESMSQISDKFIVNMNEYANNGENFDFRQYIGAFAMDVISSCAYGINPDSINNPKHPIVVNAKRIFGTDFGFTQIISGLAPPLGRFLRLEFFDLKAVEYFDVLTNKIVEERKKVSNNTQNKRTDFLQLMIDQENDGLGIDPYSDDESFPVEDKELSKQKINVKTSRKSDYALTSDELTAQGILFFIAGYDTTSAAISHAIYYLCQYKDVQQKLYEELRENNDFSYESLNKLVYLNAVIKETLRLAPSLTRIQRECLKDYKLGNTGITIPAGTSVEILPYALHRIPELFPEPEVFKPERFIDPTHHPYAYLPFGGGPRVCIGMRFALYEMRMIISKLIHKFQFELQPGFKIDYFDVNILISPKTLLVNIKHRE